MGEHDQDQTTPGGHPMATARPAHSVPTGSAAPRPSAADPSAADPTAADPVMESRLTRPTTLLLSVATGLSVASLYYAQPLLADIRQTMHLSSVGAGLVVTVTQLGYALSLLLLVPLGDLLERRRLVTVMCLLSAVSLAAAGLVVDAPLLYVCALVIGFFSTTAQMLVAFTAMLAGPAQRGRAVGTVMSGLLLGILLARTVAGYLALLGGWRTVYFVAAVLMALLGIALRAWLPASPPTGTLRYGALLRSVFALLREERLLRLRSAYGALGFAGFSVLWTPIGLMLAAPPYHFSASTIGLFGLAGVAGAGAAGFAGRAADRGQVRLVTGAGALLLTVSWLPLALGGHSLTALVIGIVGFDLACQGLHITNQSQIYTLRPEARSRLTAAYMLCYFVGGVVGSALASLVYTSAHWGGICVLGAGLGALACLLWLLETVRGR